MVPHSAFQTTPKAESAPDMEEERKLTDSKSSESQTPTASTSTGSSEKNSNVSSEDIQPNAPASKENSDKNSKETSENVKPSAPASKEYPRKYYRTNFLTRNKMKAQAAMAKRLTEMAANSNEDIKRVVRENLEKLKKSSESIQRIAWASRENSDSITQDSKESIEPNTSTSKENAEKHLKESSRNIEPIASTSKMNPEEYFKSFTENRDDSKASTSKEVGKINKNELSEKSEGSKSKTKVNESGEWEMLKCCMEKEIGEKRFNHMKDHHAKEAIECLFCHSKLSSRSSLDRHILTHARFQPYTCRVCNKKFSTNGNMHRHMKTHQGHAKFVKMESHSEGEKISSGNDKKRHLNSPEFLTCGLGHRQRKKRRLSLGEGCSKSSDENKNIDYSAGSSNLKVKTEPELKSESHRGLNDFADISAIISNVAQNQVSSADLNMSEEMSNSRATGDESVDNLPMQWLPDSPETSIELDGSTSTSNEEIDKCSEKKESDKPRAPYTCRFCNRKFKNHYILQKHIIKHSKERTFKCTKCTATFQSKPNAIRHIEMVHKEDKKEANNYIAYNCEKGAAAESRIMCEWCGQNFTSSLILGHHKRASMGCRAKPFLCLVCNKKFSTKNNGKRHQAKHHPEKRDENCIIPNALAKNTVNDASVSFQVSNVNIEIPEEMSDSCSMDNSEEALPIEKNNSNKELLDEKVNDQDEEIFEAKELMDEKSNDQSIEMLKVPVPHISDFEDVKNLVHLHQKVNDQSEEVLQTAEDSIRVPNIFDAENVAKNVQMQTDTMDAVYSLISLCVPLHKTKKSSSESFESHSSQPQMIFERVTPPPPPVIKSKSSITPFGIERLYTSPPPGIESVCSPPPSCGTESPSSSPLSLESASSPASQFGMDNITPPPLLCYKNINLQEQPLDLSIGPMDLTSKNEYNYASENKVLHKTRHFATSSLRQNISTTTLKVNDLSIQQPNEICHFSSAVPLNLAKKDNASSNSPSHSYPHPPLSPNLEVRNFSSTVFVRADTEENKTAPLQCGTCGILFANSSNKRRHEKKKHQLHNLESSYSAFSPVSNKPNTSITQPSSSKSVLSKKTKEALITKVNSKPSITTSDLMQQYSPVIISHSPVLDPPIETGDLASVSSVISTANTPQVKELMAAQAATNSELHIDGNDVTCLNSIKLKEQKSGTKKATEKVSCSYCNKKFNCPSSYVRHVVTHTNEKPFACHLCDKLFTVKSNRDRHLKKSHNQNPPSVKIGQSVKKRNTRRSLPVVPIESAIADVDMKDTSLPMPKSDASQCNKENRIYRLS